MNDRAYERLSNTLVVAFVVLLGVIGVLTIGLGLCVAALVWA